jgi:8-oxo-dGTP diphosphatase
MPFSYEYPRPAVTVDIAVFCKSGESHKILLIQRGRPPFQEKWALPGGFIEMDETLEQSALRELEEETGLKNVSLEQFKTYGDPGRDPRGRTVSVVFYGFVDSGNSTVEGADDAKSADWFTASQIPEMAFDHGMILNDLVKKLKDEKRINF